MHVGVKHLRQRNLSTPQMSQCENKGDRFFPFRQRKDLKTYQRCHLLLSGNLLAVSQDKEKRCPVFNTLVHAGQKRLLSGIWRRNHAWSLLIKAAVWQQTPRATDEEVGHLPASPASPPHCPMFPQVRHLSKKEMGGRPVSLREVHTDLPQDSPSSPHVGCSYNVGYFASFIVSARMCLSGFFSLDNMTFFSQMIPTTT